MKTLRIKIVEQSEDVYSCDFCGAEGPIDGKADDGSIIENFVTFLGEKDSTLHAHRRCQGAMKTQIFTVLGIK